MTYSYRCTCGLVTTTMADTKEQAVEQLKTQMTEESVRDHYAQNHPGESVSKQQVDDLITNTIQEGDFSADNANLNNSEQSPN